MSKYLENLKNIFEKKEKRVENLVFLIILLVVFLVAINYVFTDSSTTNEENSNSTSTEDNIDSTKTEQQGISDDTEKKLEEILSQISGIGNVSVMITYSKESTVSPVYNTKETNKNGETTSEKTVVYNEEGSDKTVVIETVEMPKVEGVIVVAEGVSSTETKSKIANAISALTNIASYKVQVFDKK